MPILDANGSPIYSNNGRRRNPAMPRGQLVAPPKALYSAVWSQGTRSYTYRFDESVRSGDFVSLTAMRRDAYIQQLLLARCTPTVQQPVHVEGEEGFEQVAEEIEGIIHNCQFWQQMLISLLVDGVFGGRSAVQLAYDYRTLGKKRYLVPIGHSPIQTDKIMWRDDATPGLLIYTPYASQDKNANCSMTDRGMALWLDTPAYRDRVVIFKFITEDQDWLLESQQASMRFGVGLRHYAWHTYRQLVEVRSWILDAMQRVSTSGMLYTTFDSGNAQQEEDALQALINLCRDNVAAFPRSPGDTNPVIGNIEPSRVGYDVLFNVLQHWEDILRKLFIGQSLSDSTGATGMGSGVADLHAQTLQRIVAFDTILLQECLNRDLIDVLVKFNFPEAVGQVKLVFETERVDTYTRIEAAEKLAKIGVTMSQKNLRDLAGFAEPDSADDATAWQQGQGSKNEPEKVEAGKPKIDMQAENLSVKRL